MTEKEIFPIKECQPLEGVSCSMRYFLFFSLLLSSFFSVVYSKEQVFQQRNSSHGIRGILLVDHISKIRKNNLSAIIGIQFDGIDAPGGNDRLVQELIPFLEKPLTPAKVNDVRRAITAYYQAQNFPIVKILVPKQNTSQETLQLLVIEGRVGKLSVKKNCYTSAESVIRWMRIAPCDPIHEPTLIRDLEWLNTNPFRKVNSVLRPGSEVGTTDIDLIVWDRRKLRIYSGADNTGTPLIGRTRWFAGFNANLFFDHTVSFQFTSANRFSELNSYTLQYIAPLPWRNTLSLFGAYTGVEPRQGVLRSHGETYQASGRYLIPHWFGRNFGLDQIGFEVGFDFKGTNNNLLFGDSPTPILTQFAYIGQFVSSLSMSQSRKNHKVSGVIEVVWSPGKMLPHQSGVDFGNLRSGATAKYLYTRLSLSWEQNPPHHLRWFLMGRLQLADANLLPSEQFALGGYNTVRGYDERVVNGDGGVCGNMELRTPSFPVVGHWRSKMEDSLYFLAFVDVGYAWYREEIIGIPKEQILMGVGPGMRYRISSYLSSRLDLGFPLYSVVNDPKSPRLHFSAVLSY